MTLLATAVFVTAALIFLVVLLFQARLVQPLASVQVKAFDLTASSAATPTPNAFQSFLDIFPLVPGATWTYSDREYNTLPNHPNQIIEAIFEITHKVVDVKTVGADYFAHMQQKVKKVRSDEGWSDQNYNPPTDHDFWYIYHGNQVYSTDELPEDLQNIPFDRMILDYQFPMTQDAQWCPNRLTKSSLVEMVATPFPCQYAGMRIIFSESPQQTQIGTFEKCYQMGDIYNSGGTIQTFCDGIGIVASKYDHSGSRFGFSQVLTGFTR